MERVTYGAPRLVDWVAQIKVGSATVRVHFTGGALTAYGITPAEFTTTNPFFQKAIEGSDYFKSGRIIELHREGTPERREQRERRVNIETDAPEGARPAEADGPKSEAEESLTEVEVSCLTDAQNYLRDNFGIATSKSRSKEKAQALGRENGIVFTGLD